ncbi:MAG: hypothetical protein AB4372_25060 [Xenococcus sp. (in: cyanobacteria)]
MDLRGSVADPDAADAYPIVTYSWILAYQQSKNPQKAQVLKDVMQWGLTEGQKLGPELGYVQLPETIVQKAIAMLDRIEII